MLINPGPIRRTGGARLTGLFVCFAFVGQVGPVSADEQECGKKVEAYRSAKKVPKGDRKREIVRAEQESFDDLARRAFSVAIGRIEYETRRDVAGTSGEESRDGYTEEVRLSRVWRQFYKIDETLYGGTYQRDGDEKRMTVEYCVPRSAFERAQDRLRKERESDVEEARRRLTQVERAIAVGDLEWSRRQILNLIADVQHRVMDAEIYRSAVYGEQKTFWEVLVQWRDEIGRGADFAQQLLLEAQRAIDEGHLTLAEGLIEEARDVDAMNVRARQMRTDIADRREMRREILVRAETQARAGRFTAANASLEKARAIDSDDQDALSTAASTIAQLQAEFKYYNPRLSGDFSMGLGSLGVDPDYSAAIYEQAIGSSVGGGSPLHFGFGGQLRIGRYWLWRFSGAFDFTSFTDANGNVMGDGDSVDIMELATGLGFRTLTNAKRRTSFSIVAGAAVEYVSVEASKAQISDSDSRTGTFVRVALGFHMVSFYVEQGFWFSDDSTVRSNIGWVDSTRFGVGIVF